MEFLQIWDAIEGFVGVLVGGFIAYIAQTSSHTRQAKDEANASLVRCRHALIEISDNCIPSDSMMSPASVGSLIGEIGVELKLYYALLIRLPHKLRNKHLEIYHDLRGLGFDWDHNLWHFEKSDLDGLKALIKKIDDFLLDRKR